MSRKLPRAARIGLCAALLLQAISFLAPDYWWQGPVSRDIRLPPEPGPVRHIYLAQEIVALFHAPLDRKVPALDWAARAGEPLALLAFALVILGLRRIGIAAALLAIAAWILRIIFCSPLGFMPGYYTWIASMLCLIVAAWIARKPIGPIARWTGRISIAMLSIAAVAAATWHAIKYGPQNLNVYPNPQTSPYRLPFAPGVTRLCTQSNNGLFSHHDWQEYAYDFSMPVGSDVCAARAGKVVDIEVRFDGHSLDNNEMVIDHGDGTFGCYLHLMRGGSYVRVGDHVKQGQRIAASGDVGYSTSPHLHFHVVQRSKEYFARLIPITFQDVPTNAGIPRMLRRYTSGNTPTP